MGARVTTGMLVDAALYILAHATMEEDGVPYCSVYVEKPESTRDHERLRLDQRITPRWIRDTFMRSYQLVFRIPNVKRILTPAKQVELEKDVACHLGLVKRGLMTGSLDQDRISNMDETHVVLSSMKGKGIGRIGESVMRYIDTVAENEAMTVVMRITGGEHATAAGVMVILKNKLRSHPIMHVPDNYNNLCYRSGPKGWMDHIVFEEWLGEKRVHIMPGLPQPAMTAATPKVLYFLDNCSGHHLPDLNQQNQLLQAINARIIYFPPNTSHLVQPCDDLPNLTFKRAFDAILTAKSSDMLRNSQFSASSGKISNPGKPFFLSSVSQSFADSE